MYTIINLGSLLIFFVIFPVAYIFELLLRLINCKHSTKLNKKLRNLLYWNSSIRFFRESYAITLMCAFINLKALTFVTNGEIVTSCFSMLIIAMAIIVPIVLIVAIWLNYHQLDNEKIKQHFGAAYD